MKIFIIAVCTLVHFSVSGQDNIAGEYISNVHLVDDIVDSSILLLNCDSTFSAKDNISSSFGKWKLKGRSIKLLVDSIIFNSKNDYKSREISLQIKSNKLYWKMPSRSELRKMRKKLEESTGEAQDSVKVFPEKDENYFQKRLNFICK